MSWMLIAALAVGIFVIRFLGLLAPEGSRLPRRVLVLIETMPLAIVASLVLVQTLTVGGRFVLDERAVGVGAALLLARTRLPLAWVVVVAVSLTTLLRALGA